jgi:hypothetical protein
MPSGEAIEGVAEAASNDIAVVSRLGAALRHAATALWHAGGSATAASDTPVSDTTAKAWWLPAEKLRVRLRPLLHPSGQDISTQSAATPSPRAQQQHSTSTTARAPAPAWEEGWDAPGAEGGQQAESEEGEGEQRRLLLQRQGGVSQGVREGGREGGVADSCLWDSPAALHVGDVAEHNIPASAC